MADKNNGTKANSLSRKRMIEPYMLLIPGLLKIGRAHV